MKVLVVDDEPSIRELLGRFLRRAGHQPLFAENGQQAWDLLREAPAVLDAIFCDIRMPVMDGLEFLRILRGAGHAVPVILLSGQIPLEPTDAAEAGATTILHKPFRLADVDAALRSVVWRKPPSPAEAAP
jgi:DNA-binding response OmpR family regulator